MHCNICTSAINAIFLNPSGTPTDTCSCFYSLLKRIHFKNFHFVVWFLGIFFKYDLSSIMVRVENRRRSFWGFLVRLCGIVGGIFATSGNNSNWRGTHSVWNKTLFSFIKQLFYSANLRQFGGAGGESSRLWDLIKMI